MGRPKQAGYIAEVRWNVWVDEWQMECCGDPFHVGSTVTWTLAPADREWLTRALGEETAATIEWGEEHHDEPTAAHITVEAQVKHISAVHARHVKAEGDTYLHPTEGVLTPLTSADRSPPPPSDDRDLIGYIVTLEAAD